ncbi:hypothetical protein D3C71_1922580 [compost metagenome]
MYLQQAKHRVEQVVLGQRGIAEPCQAVGIDAEVLLVAVGEPGQQRHVLLRLGSDGVGRAVQEQVVLTQRLAMVGQVDHRRVDLVLLAAQGID